MSKICFWGDCHFSQYSSIIRSRTQKVSQYPPLIRSEGQNFSSRLENEIASLNWVEQLAVQHGCDSEICLGDFFDKSELVAEELTALNLIQWNNLPKTFLVGNHEMGRSDLSFSSSHLFNSIPGCFVIDKTSCFLYANTLLCFLPYSLEDNRKSLSEELDRFSIPKDMYNKIVVFSHNDISGIQMGKFKSTIGYSIEDIEQNCDLFINGHLHNSSWITDKIFNAGNLTGQNFSEDALIYNHCAYILDIDTLSIESYENPYAFNFYKIDEVEDNTDRLKDVTKNNAVVSLKIRKKDYQKYQDILNSMQNIVEKRILVEPDTNDGNIDENSIKDLRMDHISEFYNYILDSLGNNEVVLSELGEVCK